MQERCLVENNLRLEVNRPHHLNEQIYFSLGRIAASEINPDFTSSEKKKIAKISIRMKSCFLCQTLFSNVCLESWPSLRRRGRSRKKQSALFLLLIESCALQLRLSMIDLQHKKAAKQKLIEGKGSYQEAFKLPAPVVYSC